MDAETGGEREAPETWPGQGQSVFVPSNKAESSIEQEYYRQLLVPRPQPPVRFGIQIPSPPLATHNQSLLSTRPTINQSIKKPTQSHNRVINQSSLCGGPLLRAGHRIHRRPGPRMLPALVTCRSVRGKKENREVRQSVRVWSTTGGVGKRLSTLPWYTTNPWIFMLRNWVPWRRSVIHYASAKETHHRPTAMEY